MSDNNILNAIIAFIEGRPEVGREILRRPENGSLNISDVSARLYKAIDIAKQDAVRETLRKILRRTMAIKPPPLTTGGDATYIEGVVDVEKLIEEFLHENS
jgi:capsid portal protein